MRKIRSHVKADRRGIRPSWRSVLPMFVVSIAVSWGVHLLTKRFELRPLLISLDALGLSEPLPLSVTLLVFVVLMSRPLIRLVDSYYVIGKHHLYAIKGRISLQRRLIEVPYEDMRGVRAEQGIIERCLNIGSVVVWTASAESSAVSLRGIANPDGIVNELRRRIDHARLKRPYALPGEDLEIQHRAPARATAHSSS